MTFQLLSLLLPLLIVTAAAAANAAVEYGVDCSFPIHSKEFRCGDILGDRAKVYEEFMDGCRKKYSGGNKAKRCDSTENDRIEMSLRQPQSMVNYTSTGYKKIKAPKALFEMLKSYWNDNKQMATEETWPIGNVYVNHWSSPTFMVSVEDRKLRGGGYEFKKQLWDVAKSTIEQWTGMEQEPTSMYGIRKYTTGAILSPHVDRMPLVSSCIINVAQDVDEPWPLEVIDRQGKAVNVTMEPGDMVLYESGSLIHARPFALQGRYYANIFIHFQPTGRPLGDTSDDYLDTLDGFYPPYILQDSPEMSNWASQNPGGWKRNVPSGPVQQYNQPEAHKAAAVGDMERLSTVAQKNRKALKLKDKNGWQPIHEAARAGQTAAVKLLLKHGAEKDARTGHKGDGVSPLNLALGHLEEDHDLIFYLRSIGAKDYGYSSEL